MKVLHWEFSPLFDAYYKVCRARQTSASGWEYTDCLPAPYCHSYDGAFNPVTGVIYMRKSMETQKAEVVAAHELTHATHPPFPATQTSINESYYNYLGSQIQSCLQDVLVFRDLRAFGFDISAEMDERFQALVHNKSVREFYIRDGTRYPGNCLPLDAIAYVERYHYFSSCQERWAVVRGYYETMLPEALSLGTQLLEASEHHGYRTPLRMLTCLTEWTKILGVQDIVNLIIPRPWFGT